MKPSLFIIIFCLSFSSYSETLNQALALLNKRHSVLAQVGLDKSNAGNRDKKKYYNLAFNFHDVKYELEAGASVNAAEFAKNQKNSTALILKNYQDEPLPYQGEITNVAVCPKEFFPVQTQEKRGSKEIFIVKYFTGKAYNYRICDKKLIAYSSCTAFYHDRKKSQYFKLKVSAKPDSDCAQAALDFFEHLLDL